MTPMAKIPTKKTDEIPDTSLPQVPSDKRRGIVTKRYDEDEKKQKRFRWEFFRRSKVYQDHKAGKIGHERKVCNLHGTGENEGFR